MSVQTRIMIQSIKPAPCVILASRSQYSPCHIHVPDLDQRLAAIQLNDEYYSFFRAIPDSKRALGFTVKLSYRGDRATLTQIPKGYSIWVWEPEARPSQTSIPPKMRLPFPETASCKILISPEQYQLLDIRVPDLDKPLSAVMADGKYYSIFRTVTESARILDLVAKITQRGEETIVARVKDGYAVCVWEAEAQPYMPTNSISFA